MNDTNIRIILHNLKLKTFRMSSAFVCFYARSRVSIYFFHSRSLDKKKIFDFKKYLAYFDTVKRQIAYFIDIMNMLSNFNQDHIYLLKKVIFIQNILNLILVKFYFIKKTDLNNATLTINPGQGGLDSQNFVKMLMKMYLKLFERFNFKTRVTNLLNGENDGIKIVTIHISGEYAYGYFKSEIGVHRLLRNSQFNAQKKRHTSFASVWVKPETLHNNIAFSIIDVFRAKGSGGQHVNKTNSAVRITHIPTKVTVICQSERSQSRNKTKALADLQEKLNRISMQNISEKRYGMEVIKTTASFGHQIRNYIITPYQLIKDLRSTIEFYNIESIFNGDAKAFIISFLIWTCL